MNDYKLLFVGPFLHCPIAKELWTMVLGLFGVHTSQRYAEVGLGYVSFLAGSVWSSSEHSHLEGSATLFDVVSLEGKESRSFEDCEWSILDLKLFFFQSLFDCILALELFSIYFFIGSVWSL